MSISSQALRIRTAFAGARDAPHHFGAKFAASCHSKNQDLLKDKSSPPQRPWSAEPPILPKRESGANPRRDPAQASHTEAIRVGVPYQGECMMGRIIGFLFGLLAYAVFLGTFVYA